MSPAEKKRQKRYLRRLKEKGKVRIAPHIDKGAHDTLKQLTETQDASQAAVLEYAIRVADLVLSGEQKLVPASTLAIDEPDEDASRPVPTWRIEP